MTGPPKMFGLGIGIEVRGGKGCRYLGPGV